MKFTTARNDTRGNELLRFVLAAIVGLAIVAIVAASTRSPVEAEPRFDQLQRGNDTLVWSADHRSDPLILPRGPNQNIKPPQGQPDYPEFEPSPADRYRKTSPPKLYDGIWDDPNFLILIRRVA